MRKYQQLLLLLLSIGSCTILLIYKSENAKLKYVLQVVNFFSRSDAALLRRDNATENIIFESPLPVWQVIGNTFHAYSAYWNRNRHELIAGGEAIVTVAGYQNIIDFRCFLIYEDDNDRSVQGKFHFQRAGGDQGGGNDLTIYIFFCRLTRDFGSPAAVSFVDVTDKNKVAHKLRLRHIKNPDQDKGLLQHATICVDLVNFNRSLSFDRDEQKLLQFFMHHHYIGINHFIVYNGDEIPIPLINQVNRLNIHLHLLPFNFPFDDSKAKHPLRQAIYTDCLLRNMNWAQTVMILEPNEFFFSNTKLEEGKSVFQSLRHYAADITRFELAAKSVCIGQSKLLMDNKFYDPDAPIVQKHIYRSNVPISTALSESASHSVGLPLSTALLFRYIKCSNGAKELHDWRNSVHEDFIENVQLIRDELRLLL